MSMTVRLQLGPDLLLANSGASDDGAAAIMDGDAQPSSPRSPFLLADHAWLELARNMRVIEQQSDLLMRSSARLAPIAHRVAELPRQWHGQVFTALDRTSAVIGQYGAAAAETYTRASEALEGDPSARRSRLRLSLQQLMAQAINAGAVAEQLHQSVLSLAERSANLWRELEPQYLAALDAERKEFALADANTTVLATTHDTLRRSAEENAAEAQRVMPIPIGGPIHAAILMKRASDSRAAADRLRPQLAELGHQREREHYELIATEHAHGAIAALGGGFGTLTPILQKLRGIWAALANDLKQLAVEITEDLDRNYVITLTTALRQAGAGWSVIAAEADKFRSNLHNGR